MDHFQIKSGLAGVAASNGVVGQNLLIARTTLGWSQQRLAAASGVSRGTVVQLEAGVCDPRLSTIELLARAMGVSPALLLFGEGEFRAVSELGPGEPWPAGQGRSKEALDRVLGTGHYRSRLEAALQGADIAARAGLTGAAQLVGAAIGSARLASRGTFVGAALARLMERHGGAGPRAGDEVGFAENI